MPYEFKIVRESFMDAAEPASLRSLGLAIHTTDPEPVGWVRVHADCDLNCPLRFDDAVEVRLLVREKHEKSLVYSFGSREVNGLPHREVARGTQTVACGKRGPESGEPTAVPATRAIAVRIDVAPAESVLA
jgi:acyl-CoA thioesterase FadM